MKTLPRCCEICHRDAPPHYLVRWVVGSESILCSVHAEEAIALAPEQRIAPLGRGLFVLRLALALALAGCASSASSGSSSASSPPAACREMADVVATAAQRCGLDYQRNYDAFVKAAVGGDCAATIAVRDEASLRSVCMPWYAAASCDELKAGVVDPSCKAQLVH